MERKVINIFIASPNDLAQERQKLRSVSERINKVFGRELRVHIELLGWEDTLPGCARPQAIINKDVEICDLFVGMLWKRWGTASGRYSSGFEEEFHIATKRHEEGDDLDIWMFFKRVDDDLREDPGEQLRRVIEFKQELVERKQLLFKEFDNAETFEKIIYDSLATFLLQSNADLREPSSSKSSSKPVSTSETAAAVDEHAKETPKAQLRSACEKLFECIDGDDFSKISFWERLRSFLSAFSLFSGAHLGETLGSHEVNLIFRKRREWKLFPHERIALIRAHLGDKYGYVPGRYWLIEESKANPAKLLTTIALEDLQADVRRGAIQLLVELHYQPPVELLEKLFQAENQDERLLAIDLARNSNDKKVLPLLESTIEDQDESVGKKALSMYIDCLYQYDPHSAFQTFTEKSTEVTDLFKAKLVSKDLNVEVSDILDKGLSANSRVRLFSAQYLQAINRINSRTAQLLLEDIDSQIRKIGFEWLLNNGREFSIEEASRIFPGSQKERTNILGLGANSKEVTEADVAPLILMKYSKEKLENLVEFYTEDGIRAYEILVSEFSLEVKDRLKSDLENDFEELIAFSQNRLRAIFGEQSERFIDSHGDLNVWSKQRLVSAAIGGLLNDSDPDDVKYARDYLPKMSVLVSAAPLIQMINRYGDESDIPLLLEARKSVSILDAESLVGVAVNLSEAKIELVDSLLESEDKGLAVAAINNVDIFSREEALKICKKQIYSDNDGVRNHATAYITKLMGKLQLEALLNEYVESEAYYYDVVCGFEKCINEI